jgi:hypothetical protein
MVLKKMLKKFFVICILISIIGFSFAFTIDMPEELLIEEEDSFFLVEINNNSNTTKNLEIVFFTNTESEIIAPKAIAPNMATTAKIFIKNSFSNYTEVDSKIEVYLGNELKQKRILLKFNPNPTAIQNQSNSTNALFALFIGLESLTFGTFEYVLLFAMILIILVLIIAFFVRISKR